MQVGLSKSKTWIRRPLKKTWPSWLIMSEAPMQRSTLRAARQVPAKHFDAYDDETVLYYDRKEHRGIRGIQEFIDLLPPFNMEFGSIIDVGSTERVTLVIEEPLEREADGARMDYVRKPTYRLEGGTIKECWIINFPPRDLSHDHRVVGHLANDDGLSQTTRGATGAEARYPGQVTESC
ncbi:hypothetical protein [Leifsonia shinshuensis]|uniref:hypothetical protein n=1 Tax=Leifsonia shinshuensis TaxID=150026 RepID=UPI0028577005|nr:hypothetical protein [Leifsonia shinshuensis]MDR6972911.1 hypothetical protein [Leifsonia shinshuensis]